VIAIRASAELDSGCGIKPLGVLRFDDESCIQADLLVRGRTK